MELNLPAVYRAVFIILASTFAYTICKGDVERAGRISGLFVLVGITSTFQGIASGLGSRLGTEGSAQEALLAGLALSLGGSIVGFILTFAAEIVLCFAFGLRPTGASNATVLAGTATTALGLADGRGGVEARRSRRFWRPWRASAEGEPQKPQRRSQGRCSNPKRRHSRKQR